MEGGGGWGRGWSGGGDRESSAGTESDPRAGETAFRSASPSLRSRKPEPEMGRPRAESTVQERGDGGERETESADRAASGEREREDQKGLRDSARESRGWGWGRRSPGSRQSLPAPRGAGAPGSRALGPHCPRRSLRPQEPRWAVLRRHPAGWRREGKVRGSEAAAGSRTYVRSACWRRRCAELGDSGPRAPHIAPPARGRAGQDRLDCARRPVRPGFARVWLPESGGPSWSLLSVPRTSQWRAVPSHAPGCLAPEGGRRGGRERGVGGTGPPGLPSRGVPGDGLRGARSLPGGKAVGNPNGGPVPPREDFRGKFSFRQTINTPIGWQATLS